MTYRININRYTYEYNCEPGTTFTADDVIKNARDVDSYEAGSFSNIEEARSAFEAAKSEADAYEERTQTSNIEYHFKFVELESEDEDGEFEIIDQYAVGINEN